MPKQYDAAALTRFFNENPGIDVVKQMAILFNKNRVGLNEVAQFVPHIYLGQFIRLLTIKAVRTIDSDLIKLVFDENLFNAVGMDLAFKADMHECIQLLWVRHYFEPIDSLPRVVAKYAETLSIKSLYFLFTRDCLSNINFLVNAAIRRLDTKKVAFFIGMCCGSKFVVSRHNQMQLRYLLYKFRAADYELLPQYYEFMDKNMHRHVLLPEAIREIMISKQYRN